MPLGIDYRATRIAPRSMIGGNEGYRNGSVHLPSAIVFRFVQLL
jgi:hypothetical protein